MSNIIEQFHNIAPGLFLSVLYGSNDKKKDVTWAFMHEFYNYRSNTIVIKKGVHFNNYFGDFFPHIVKTLSLQFKDGPMFIFPEQLNESFCYQCGGVETVL